MNTQRRIPPREILSAAIVLLIGLAADPVRAEACPDDDLDGYADCTVPGCDATGLLCGDCDDADGARNPGETEACNHADEDCNGVADDGFVKPATAVFVTDPEAGVSDRFGFAIASLGDVTGDGVDDFVVGMPWKDQVYPLLNVGEAVIVSGASREIVCRAHQPSVAAGASRDDWAALNNAGSVVVLSGADGATIRKPTDPAGEGADEFGSRLAALGDLDGDGVRDLAVGVPLQGPLNLGRVVLFSGATGDHIRTLSDGSNAEGQDDFGESVGGIADADADGIGDVCDPE